MNAEPESQTGQMTRLRAFAYCCISFALATLLHWLTWNAAFWQGSIVRGALVVADERDFWSAIDAKIPVERNGYRFYPHTNNKEISVAEKKSKKRIVKDSPVSYGVGSK